MVLIYVGIYEAKVKSSNITYNWRETRDKRPLDKDPDRSWCHRHTSVKLFWSQLRYAADVHGAMGSDQKCFIILLVWQWHWLVSGSLSNDRLSRVSRRVGRELFILLSYILRWLPFAFLGFFLGGGCFQVQRWKFYVNILNKTSPRVLSFQAWAPLTILKIPNSSSYIPWNNC